MIRFNGEQFLKDFKIRYSSDGSNVSQGWIGTACPFCNDRSDHLGIHLATGALSCWRCGRHSALDYIALALRIPKSEAKSIYSIYLTKKSQFSTKNVKLHSSVVSLPEQTFSPQEQMYLNKRNITDEHIKLWDLRGGGILGEWAFRIVIPIIYNSVIVSATGRTIANIEPKYYSLKSEKSIMDLKHIFLGLDLAEDTVAVVEGPIDAIRGGPGFISSFGATLSDEQLLILKKFTNIYFIRDMDKAGEQFVEDAYKLSSMCTNNIEVISIDEYKDIGGASEKYIKELRGELCL